jgi:hypothetical protein
MKSIKVNKTVVKGEEPISLIFRDAINYVAPSKLDGFAKDFGGVKNEKTFWPYEAYTIETAHEYLMSLSPTNPPKQSDFHSNLNTSDISDANYKKFCDN